MTLIHQALHQALHQAALAIFLLSAAATLYVYLGYPLLLALLAACLRKPLPPPAALDDAPSLTLLICAHNEAAHIARKLHDSLALAYPRDKLQILIVSDGSTDTTEAIVETFASHGVELLRIPRQSGKTHAQNLGVQHARGSILVFSDATTHYSPNALLALAGHYRNPSIGAVSGRYLYQDPARTSATGPGASAYSSYDNTVRLLQSHIASITGCCGCIYSVRRALYTPLPTHLISDLVQPLHVLLQGYRVTFDPRALASESSTASSRNEFHMRVRVVTRALRGLLSVPTLLLPWRHPWLALQLWSHKLLRWAVPFYLAGLLLSSAVLAQSPVFRIALAAQLLLYATAAVTVIVPLHRRWRLLGLPLYFCTLNAAAVAGLLQLLRGYSYTVWQPQREDSHAPR